MKPDSPPTLIKTTGFHYNKKKKTKKLHISITITTFTDFKITAASEVVDALVKLFVVAKVPRAGQDAVDGNVSWQVIRVTVFIAVHSSNYTFAGTDQKTRWSVYVVCPTW